MPCEAGNSCPNPHVNNKIVSACKETRKTALKWGGYFKVKTVNLGKKLTFGYA